MKIITGAAVGLLAFQAAYAQTPSSKRFDDFLDTPLQLLGVYLTHPVADRYRKEVAAKFLEGAGQAGFSNREASAFAEGMAKGEIRFESVQKGPSTHTADANSIDTQISSRTATINVQREPSKAGFLLSFANEKSVSAFLEKYSTIKLVVQPAPPRDYKVIINGEECPATDAGIYKVLPGQSVVDASRPSKPKCEWKGSIAPGGVQEVNCPL